MKGPVRGQDLVVDAAWQAFASDGTAFQPASDLWSFRTLSASANFNFGILRSYADSDLVASAKAAFKPIIETRNLNSALTAYRCFKGLVITAHQRRDDLSAELDAEDLALWCSRGNAAYLGQLNPLLKVWRKLNLAGINADLFEFAENVRIPGSTDKDVVRTWDPDAGAYRPAEDVVLKAALDAAFNEGEATLYEYALARMLRGTGMRPAQLAAMKCCDLRQVDSRFELHIPLVKQRGVPERGEFMPWKPITQGLADILRLHVQQNVYSRVTSDFDPTLAPLFPPKRSRLLLSDGLEGHVTRDGISKPFQAIFMRLHVISPITGRVISVSPTRERHTVLTGLAMQGCTATEIAANAGHSDPTSCLPYIDASIQHFQRMERLVGEAFIPLADRFLGKVIREHDDQRAHDDPDSVVRGRDLTGVGSCTDGGCGAIAAGVAPLACYECRKFRAWADAPHEYILGQLIAEQHDLIEAGHPDVAETKTSTIVAITDLLEAIRVREVANG